MRISDWSSDVCSSDLLREDCRALGLDYEHYYHIYKRETRESHFLYAVCFTSVVTLGGLTAVMLGLELGLNEQPHLLLLGPFEAATAGEIEKYQTDTPLLFGMPFLRSEENTSESH